MCPFGTLIVDDTLPHPSQLLTHPCRAAWAVSPLLAPLHLCVELLKFLSLCSKEHERTKVGQGVPPSSSQAHCTSPFVLFSGCSVSLPPIFGNL